MSASISLNNISQFFADLKKQRFFGRMSFDFKDGDVVLARKEETIRVNYNNSNYEGITPHEHANASTSSGR